MTLGEKLQKLRAREGVSQDRLADLLGVSRQAVSKWERDETMPEAEKIVRISDYFQVTTDYLLKDEPEKFSKGNRRLPDLETWYREKGYQLGWLLAAYGIWRFIRTGTVLPFGEHWWDWAWMFLGYSYVGVMVAAIGVLVAILGRRCAGKLSWYHLGWLPVFWGGLEVVRIALLQVLYRNPPENMFFSSEQTFGDRYGGYLLFVLLAAAAGSTVFFVGKSRAAAKKE